MSPQCTTLLDALKRGESMTPLKWPSQFYGAAKLCKECAKDYQHNYYHKQVKA